MQTYVKIVVMYCTSIHFVFSVPTTSLPICEKNGKHFAVGELYKPTPCEECRCYPSGHVFCTIGDCFAPCVDPIHDPNGCCPICPNGPNCNIQGHIVPVGQSIMVNNHTSCSCSGELHLHFGIGGNIPFCRLIANTVP